MKQITLILYTFNELKKAAKQYALTRHRDLNLGFDWWADEFEDFVQLCAYMGISVEKESIEFRGFYAQGDGSAFSAAVDLLKLDTAIQNQSWKDFAPMQEFPFTPSGIDRRVMALVAQGILPNEPQISARRRQFGLSVDLGIYVVNECGKEHICVFEELEKLQEWLRSIAETLNSYLYKTLENQYDFLSGDTAIKESILNSEYLFTADGRSAEHLLELNTK